jgi:hypothetical protein
MEEEDVIQYPFEFFLEKRSHPEKHSKDPFFQSLITKYPCFLDKQENHSHHKKWNQRHHQKPLSRKTERTRIGNQDPSIENILRKDFQTILNKLTDSNLDSMTKKTKTNFNKDHMSIYTDLLFDYLKRQPDFQKLYIHILETLYKLLSDIDIQLMNTLWQQHWTTYNQNKEWHIDQVVSTEDYDVFCSYIKKKKNTLALAQAWGRLMTLGSICFDPYEWLNEIADHCKDSLNTDCYISQMQEFYKALPVYVQKNIPPSYLFKIENLKDTELPKIAYFKLLEFIDLLSLKNNRLIKHGD